MVGLPVGLFVGSCLMFGGLLSCGCCLLLLSGGKAFRHLSGGFVSG